MKHSRGLFLVALLVAVFAIAAGQVSGAQGQAASSTEAAKGSDEAPAEKQKWREVTVEEAAALHKSGAVFFDANNERFRKKHGIVPGATLLASSARYDVAKTLPKDKEAELVFYCSSRT